MFFFVQGLYLALSFKRLVFRKTHGTSNHSTLHRTWEAPLHLWSFGSTKPWLYITTNRWLFGESTGSSPKELWIGIWGKIQEKTWREMIFLYLFVKLSYSHTLFIYLLVLFGFHLAAILNQKNNILLIVSLSGSIRVLSASMNFSWLFRFRASWDLRKVWGFPHPETVQETFGRKNVVAAGETWRFWAGWLMGVSRNHLLNYYIIVLD